MHEEDETVCPVVEIAERDVGKVHVICSEREAVAKANQLLKEHIGQIGHLDEFENGDGEGDEWQKATAGNCNAWCNWSGINYDAHIIQATFSESTEDACITEDDNDLNDTSGEKPKCIYVGADGVRIMHLFDGKWYCSFRDYVARKNRLGDPFSLDGFKEWCNKHNLIPIIDQGIYEEDKRL